MSKSPTNQGILHRHEDGTEHRHFSPGFTIGKQVIADHDGTEKHSHGVLGDPSITSGPVVWTELDGEAPAMPTTIRVVVDAFHGKLVGVHGELDPRQVAS